MAILKPFKGAPAVPIAGIKGLDGYELVCTEAGRTDHGLTGVVVVKNGAFATDPQEVRFASEDSRTLACTKLAAQLKVTPQPKAAALEAPLRALYEKTEIVLRTPATESTPQASERYSVQNGCLCRRGPDDTWVPLCTFTAAITELVVRDDGAEERAFVRLSGSRATGQPFPTVLLPRERYSAMNWPFEEWGLGAVVYAGQGTKDHLRAAIQLLSTESPPRRIYTHTGWRLVEDQWVFLHGGGAIGADGAVPGIDVELEGKLRLATLPDPPTGAALQDAVRASLAMLEITAETITAPVQATAYRAPLNEALPLDTSVFPVGATGGLKTSLTALAQAHFGAGFNDRMLPGSWLSTGNSLEKLCFVAKDIVCVIDDFVPRGSAPEVDRIHGQADRLLRAIGNQAARGRLRADTGQRPEYTPRSAVLTSGEDLPRGHSLGARILVVHVGPDDITIAALGPAQTQAARGAYAAAMAGYIQWLAGRYAALKTEVPQRFLALREGAQRDGVHLRMPATEAHLLLGWEYFLAFATDCAAITPAEQQAYLQRVRGALGTLTSRTQAHLAAQDPAQRFLALLSSALSSGLVHLTTKDGGTPPEPARWGWHWKDLGEEGVWQEKGQHVGWLVGSSVYLNPNAAHAAMRRYALQTGADLGLEANALWRRLKDKGLLADHDPDGAKIKRTVGGSRQEVVAVAVHSLEAPAPKSTESTETGTPPGRGSAPLGAPLGAPSTRDKGAAPPKSTESTESTDFPTLPPSVSENASPLDTGPSFETGGEGVPSETGTFGTFGTLRAPAGQSTRDEAGHSTDPRTESEDAVLHFGTQIGTQTAVTTALHAQWEALSGFDDPQLDTLWALMIRRAGALSERVPEEVREKLAEVLDQADAAAEARDGDAFGAVLARLDELVATRPNGL